MFTVVTNDGQRLAKYGVPPRYPRTGWQRVTGLTLFVLDGGGRVYRAVQPDRIPWLRADGSWNPDCGLWPRLPADIPPQRGGLF